MTGVATPDVLKPHPEVHTLSTDYGLRCSNIAGHFYSPFVRQSAVRWLRQNYDTQANDVFIMSYHKCGSHWVRKLCVEVMIQSGDPIYTTNKKYRFGDWMAGAPWIEVLVSQAQGVAKLKEHLQDTRDTLRFFSSHAPFRLFPARSIHPDTRIITITRNPKDVVLSAFSHFSSTYKTDPLQFHPRSFADFARMFNDGLTLGGNFFRYTREWYEAAFMSSLSRQILWLYYEDLREDPEKMVRLIARFLGRASMLDDQKYKQIVKRSSIKAMQDLIVSGYTDFEQADNFFRRGGNVGGWQRILSQGQSREIDQNCYSYFYGTHVKYYLELSDEFRVKKSEQ